MAYASPVTKKKKTKKVHTPPMGNSMMPPKKKAKISHTPLSNPPQIYSQAKDKTANAYFTKKQSFFGEKGMKKQLLGKKPTDTDVRENAIQNSFTDGHGTGLHELAPTNMRGEPMMLSNPFWPGFQSGMRTNTNLQYFNRKAQKKDKSKTGTDEVGGHTGAMKPKFTRRRGQGPGHDTMRKFVRSKKKPTDKFDTALSLMDTHLSATPHGQNMLGSQYLVGSRPNLKGVGQIEPVSSKKKRTNAIKLAKITHDSREAQKLRAKTLAKLKTLKEPGSPLRKPIEDDGTGGGYFTDDLDLDTSMVPQFAGNTPTEISANLGGWLTQPGRQAQLTGLYNYPSKKKKKATVLKTKAKMKPTLVSKKKTKKKIAPVISSSDSESSYSSSDSEDSYSSSDSEDSYSSSDSEDSYSSSDSESSNSPIPVKKKKKKLVSKPKPKAKPKMKYKPKTKYKTKTKKKIK